MSGTSLLGVFAKRLEQGAKPATVNYELAMLRRAFRLGGRAGKVAARPEIQMLHVENTRKGFFEPEQYRAVVKHLPEHPRPLAAIAYITGWRAMSELLSRQWRHVDLAKRRRRGAIRQKLDLVIATAVD